MEISRKYTKPHKQHCLLMLIATTGAISFVVTTSAAAVDTTIATNFHVEPNNIHWPNIMKHIYKYSQIIKFNIKGICVLAVFSHTHPACG